MALLGAKVTTSPVDYTTMVGAGLVKYGEERILAPYIGNATLMSGAIKGVAGFAAHKFLDGGLIGNSLSLGFTVDAVEDILTALIGGNMGGLFGGNNDGGW